MRLHLALCLWCAADLAAVDAQQSNCITKWMTPGDTLATPDKSSSTDNHVKLPRISNIKAVSFWLNINSVQDAFGWDYILDARPGLADGWIAKRYGDMNIGSNWNVQYYTYENEQASRLWAMPVYDKWVFVYAQADYAFTEEITLLTRYSENEDLAAKVASFTLWDAALTQQQIEQLAGGGKLTVQPINEFVADQADLSASTWPTPDGALVATIQRGTGSATGNLAAEVGLPACIECHTSGCGVTLEAEPYAFVYVDQEMSWEDARAHCRANYHDLASIHSSSENAAVAALCPNRCWIGGSDSAQEGTWTWSDGTAWDYENWYTPNNEPNNCCGGQDFLRIYGWDYAGRWDDTYEHLQPFVCSTRPRGTDEEDDGDDLDGDALVVILCVIGAFFGGAVFVGATMNKCAAKSAKVAATTGATAVPNAATDDGDMITVEAPPGKLGLKFEGTSTIVKEVFSDSPLVGKVYPGDALKSINGMLTAGKLIHLAAAASDGTKPRTLVFVRKTQPTPPMRPALLVRMGTVEAVHAADASAAPPVQATLVPHATVLSVQQP